MILNLTRFEWPESIDEHVSGFLSEVTSMERYYKNLLNLSSDQKNVSFENYFFQIQANFKIVDCKIDELMKTMEAFLQQEMLN